MPPQPPRPDDPPPLVEGLDYYVEDGKWVFTEHYLRNRGHCCESGCRHCPYGFREILDDKSRDR